MPLSMEDEDSAIKIGFQKLMERFANWSYHSNIISLNPLKKQTINPNGTWLCCRKSSWHWHFICAFVLFSQLFRWLKALAKSREGVGISYILCKKSMKPRYSFTDNLLRQLDTFHRLPNDRKCTFSLTFQNSFKLFRNNLNLFWYTQKKFMLMRCNKSVKLYNLNKKKRFLHKIALQSIYGLPLNM